VRVVNHTLLLIRRVSWFSTKISVQWGKTLTHAFLRTSEVVSAVTRARSKSHTTPNTECVTILYKKVSSVRSNPHELTFDNLWVCPRQLLLRVVNHTLLLYGVCHDSLQKGLLSEVKPSQSHFWEPLSFCFFSAVTRARSKSHTTPDTECVTILYKLSVQWGKTLTHALLRTSEFVSAVTRARSKSYATPNTECVTIFYKKNQFSEVKPS